MQHEAKNLLSEYYTQRCVCVCVLVLQLAESESSACKCLYAVLHSDEGVSLFARVNSCGSVVTPFDNPALRARPSKLNKLIKTQE